MRYEYYSNLALVSSVVVYVLAMFAHAAEWAAARRTGQTEPATTRELVGVGAADMRSEPVEGRDHVSVETPPISSPRVEQFGRVGVALTIIGFLLSVTGLLMRALAAQRAPWGNMFEFTITAMVFIVGVYLIMLWRT